MVFLGSAASNQRPRENKLRYHKRIAEKSDIVCLQETHGRIEHLLNIDTVLDRALWLKFGTFTTVNVNSGGSVILARTDTFGLVTMIEQEETFPGRDHLVRIWQVGDSCTVINLHYQPEGTLQELRRRLRAAAALWPTHPDGAGNLVGDFNICDPAEGRLNSRNQTFSDGDASRAAALLAVFRRSVEIAESFAIRKDVRRDDSIHTSSRIDRVFVNLPIAELRDFPPCHLATSVRTFGETTPSTRHPALIAFSSISRLLSYVIFHPAIWRRLTQQPLFISALDEKHRNMMYDVDPFIALDKFKDVAFRACTQSQPTTLGAQLLVACTALRAFRNGLTATVKECCESWGPVARCIDLHFVECVNFRALYNIIGSLTRDNIRAHEEELLGLDVNRAEKDMVLSKCASCQQSWAVRKPKLTIHAFSSGDDAPILDANEAAHRLSQHWGNIFSARCGDIPNDHAELMLAFVQPAPNDLNWNIGLDEFEELLASKRESAPGPDGLPYSVYRSAGGVGTKFLGSADCFHPYIQ